MTHLEQHLQERDEVRPFVHVIKRVEALLDLLGVFLVLWVVHVRRRGRGYTQCTSLSEKHATGETTGSFQRKRVGGHVLHALRLPKSLSLLNPAGLLLADMVVSLLSMHAWVSRVSGVWDGAGCVLPCGDDGGKYGRSCHK